ncbi:hypothetical protein [Streptomyces daliensis]|uniref:Integral membrane protein n=1 Tax=Streptomyces daliensis TaxID=299421 RepID=A0A8T4IVW1_9ACTN|nr:hypothetical protein [Streptomyces daliensis]
MSRATDMNATGIRTARAAVFTALCVTLSAGAHVLLSGAPVPLVPLLVISGAVFLLAFACAERERGYGRIATLLIPLELFADTVFTTGQHACYGRAGGPVAGPLRSLGVDLLCGGGSLGTPLARMTARGHEATPAALATDPAVPWLLLAAHVGVGLVAAAWLRRGEAALARLLRAAAATAFRPLRLVRAVCRCRVPAETGRTPRALPAPGPRALPLLVHSVHRRGPPVPCALAA